MKAIESVLSALKIGEPAFAGSIAVFPLFREDSGAMKYLLLDEAIERDLAKVTEISHAGSVPELAFENASPEPVLLVDGDELVGARQNRVVNITILVGAGRKLVIPVSCVEQGRWSWRSEKFSAARRSLFASARAKKMAAVSRSMRDEGVRRSDQGEIWDDIGVKMCSMGVESDTAAMSDLYASMEQDLRRYDDAFSVLPGQAGAAFVSGGRVVGLELFDAPEAFAKCFPKMVRAYAMDAPAGEQATDKAAALADVRRFLDEMLAASAEKYAALGEGEDVRIEGNGIAGGALVTEERVVHLAAYRVQPA